MHNTKDPPPCNPPPPLGGNRHLAQKAQKILGTEGAKENFLQGAKGTKPDLHCDTTVQFCGAIPPPGGGTGLTKGGRLQGGGGTSLHEVPINSARAGAVPRAPGGACHGRGNREPANRA